MGQKSEAKPLYSAGGPIVDSNFEPLLFTYAEAIKFAKKQLQIARKDGCKGFGVRDLGQYRRYSIF